MGWVTAAQHGNKTTIWSLRIWDGCLLHESKQFCAEFLRNFAEIYGAGCGPEVKVNFTSHLDGMPRLSARDEEFCEMPITTKNICDLLASCTRKRSSRLDDLLFELYIHMSDSFSELLGKPYSIWQQNGRLSGFVRRCVVTLLKTRRTLLITFNSAKYRL